MGRLARVALIAACVAAPRTAVAEPDAGASRVLLLGEGAEAKALGQRLERQGAKVLRPRDLKLPEAPVPTSADALLGAMNALVEQGRQALTELRFEEAARALAAAEVKGRERVRLHGRLDGLEEVHAQQALARLRLGDTHAADTQLRRLVAAWPEHSLDPVRFPPDLVERHAKLQQDLAASARASLTLRSEPGGATVSVDSQDSGRSPTTVSGLSPGPHHLRVTLPWAKPWYTYLELAPGRHEALELFLSPRLDRAALPALVAAATESLQKGAATVSRGALPALAELSEIDAIMTPVPKSEAAMRFTPATGVVERIEVRVEPPGLEPPPPEAPASPEAPWYAKHWWIWAGAGAAVIAGAVTAGVLLAPDTDDGVTVTANLPSEDSPFSN